MWDEACSFPARRRTYEGRPALVDTSLPAPPHAPVFYWTFTPAIFFSISRSVSRYIGW